MANKIIYLAFTLILVTQCSAFINFRGFNFFKDDSQCKIPCESIIDRVQPGSVLGMNAKMTGFTYQEWYQKSNINYCCDQMKTYDFLDGMIVPDFYVVEPTNLPDVESLVSKFTKNDDSNSKNYKYKIDIIHEFQRRAFDISANLNQLRVNMTNVESIVPDVNTCDSSFNPDNKCWLAAIHNLGEQVYNTLQIGTYQKISITIHTNEKYTEKQINQIYTSYIAEYSLDYINKAFKSKETPSIEIKYYGCTDLLQRKNWKDFLNNLSAKDYIFSPQSISQESQLNFTSIDSYHLFDQEPSEIKQCAKEIYSIVFQ